jgi:hypothetical protein
LVLVNSRLRLNFQTVATFKLAFSTMLESSGIASKCESFLEFYFVQWKPVNVITDNVIIRLLLSN